MSCELTATSSKHAIDISVPVVAPVSMKVILQPNTFLVQKSKNKYLKNVFPSGFGVNSSRDVETFHSRSLKASSDNLSMQSLTSPSKNINYIPSNMQVSENSDLNKQYFSWTNGEYNNSIIDTMTDNLSDQNLDAFADVAGPYFTSSHGFSRPTTNDYSLFRSQIPVKEGMVDFSNSVIAREIPLRTGTPAMRVKSARAKTPMTPKVYQVPAQLPKLKPFTAKSSQPQQQQQRPDTNGMNITAQYDEWLQYHRSHPESAINHEFSVLSGAETAAVSMKPMLIAKAKGQIVAPKPLLPYITVDLTSFKDMMRPTPLQHSQLYQLPSNSDFEYLRRVVMKVLPSNKADTKNITLKYFNHLTNSWKPLNDQRDWSHVVYLNQDCERDAVGLPVVGPIRIIYTISQGSELIEAIKDSYNNKVREVGMNDIAAADKGSVATPRTLTLSLITDQMSEEGMNDDASIGTRSTLLKSIEGFRKKNQVSRMNQFIPKLMFMPPKPDVNSSSIVTDHTTMPTKPVKSKEDELAKILEQRLLKTKW